MISQFILLVKMFEKLVYLVKRGMNACDDQQIFSVYCAYRLESYGDVIGRVSRKVSGLFHWPNSTGYQLHWIFPTGWTIPLDIF